MIDHAATVTIQKPVADVFKFVAMDYFQNHPKWDPRVVEIQRTSGSGPIAVGTTGREVRKQGGRTIVYTWEVSEFAPASRLGFKATSGTARFASTYTFEPAGQATKFSMHFVFQMGGLMRLAEPLMAGGFRKEIDKTAQTIKEMAEAQPSGGARR